MRMNCEMIKKLFRVCAVLTVAITLSAAICPANAKLSEQELGTRANELMDKDSLTEEKIQAEYDALLARHNKDIKNLKETRDGLLEEIESKKISHQADALRQQVNETSRQIASKQVTACTEKCLPSCYYKELQTCTFCPLFRAVFNTASSIAKHAIDTFSGSIIKVVILAFGIWIAMQVLAFVATPEVRDLKDLASSLVTQSFIVMLVVIILQNGAMDFFNQALTPIYTTGQNIAQAIIKPEEVSDKKTGDKNFDKLISSNIAACKGRTAIIDPSVKGSRGALPKAMGDSIICTMTLIQNRVAQIKALGNAALCKSWQDNFIIIPHLNYFFIGAGLWVGAMLMMLAVPFMMIDAVFELTVAAALIPFAIGAYAFKLTRGYTKKIWETFLNSMFKFVFVSLVALMLVVAFQSIITSSITNLSDLMVATEGNVVFTQILEQLPWFSTKFIKLIFVMILTWSVLNMAVAFGGEFAGSISNTTIGSSIGTMGGSFAKSAATRIMEPTLDAVGRHTLSGLKAAVVAPVHLVRRATADIRAIRAQRKGSYDEATGIYSYKSDNKEYTLKKNADGTQDVRKDKVTQTKDGGEEIQTTRQIKNLYIKTTVHTDKNGKTYTTEKVKLSNSNLKDLYRKDGTINRDFANSLRAQGTYDADVCNIALLKEALAQRVPNARFNLKNHKYVEQKALYNDAGQCIGFIETHPDGSVTKVQYKLGEADESGHQMIKTDIMRIDAKGNGVILSSDGVINQKTTFKTSDGTANGERDDSSIKTHYRLAKHYDYLYQHRAYGKVERAINNSMFSQQEIDNAKTDIYSDDDWMKSNIYEFAVNYD